MAGGHPEMPPGNPQRCPVLRLINYTVQTKV
jgi:hypothetical protein